MTLLRVAGVDWESLPGIAIASVGHLRTLLTELSAGEPGIVELVSSTGNRLQLGVGGQFACSQFIKNDNMPPYLCGKTSLIRARGDVEFLLGGTPTPVDPEQCLSVEEAFKIAEYFFNTGERDPSVEWIAV